MSALPKPNNPKLSLVPVKAFDPLAPAIVWPPVEGDTEHCAACGHKLGEHVILSRGGMRSHLRLQDTDGFRDQKRVVHYSPAQRAQRDAEFRARMVRGTAVAVTPVKTAPAVRGGVCGAERWKIFEDKMYRQHHDWAWLVLVARLEWEEGKRDEARRTVRLFRHEVAKEAAFERAQREALEDRRAEFEAQRAGF